ncbi:MAG: PilT/PilU family type 4a pilus ATPase [Planctomycetota bacterium]
MANLVDVLKASRNLSASDVFFKVGSPPAARIDGTLRFLGRDPITREDNNKIFETVGDKYIETIFRKNHEADTSLEIEGVGRFRVNMFMQRGEIGFVMRLVQEIIPSFEDLALPSDGLKALAERPRGLVLVTGIAGSGKSTTLAAMVEYLNKNHSKHVITIEDPIEYVYHDENCIIDQREIGLDTRDFTTALKNVVRQSPDVILIGEMRDMETMSAAIAAAETGHLVFSTLHTVDAKQTVERIIHYFPPHQHQLIKLQLALNLEGVISQRLLKRRDRGGRVPAVELMITSPTIRTLIEEGRTNELYPAIREGAYFGCQTFNQSLIKWIQKGVISVDDACDAADNGEELRMELKGIVKGGAGAADFNLTKPDAKPAGTPGTPASEPQCQAAPPAPPPAGDAPAGTGRIIRGAPPAGQPVPQPQAPGRSWNPTPGGPRKTTP